MNETVRFILALLLGLALPACSAGGGGDPPLKDAAIGGPFALTDQDGRAVTEHDFAGRWRIVYFGFTHCPDVCPTDLAVIGQALRAFESSDPGRAAKVVPIFISLDPERDSPAAMKEYVAAFHPRLIGLTGTPQQVAAAAKVFRIYYSKEPGPAAGGYNINHSRFAYLFGPDGAPIALLPSDQGGEAVAKELERWVR